MTFEEILDQAIAMLQRRGRLTYGTLKRQFQLDDAALDDLKEQLLYAHPQVVDDAGRGLVWTGAPGTAPAVPSVPVEPPAQVPLAYTPPYLAEKILTSRSALEGERKQVTVLFADLKGSMELQLERAIRQASAPLEHGHRLVEDLLKGHRPPSLCRCGMQKMVWEAERPFGRMYTAPRCQ